MERRFPGFARTVLLFDDVWLCVVNPWQHINNLKRFVCAFPSHNLAKRVPTD